MKKITKKNKVSKSNNDPTDTADIYTAILTTERGIVAQGTSDTILGSLSNLSIDNKSARYALSLKNNISGVEKTKILNNIIAYKTFYKLSSGSFTKNIFIKKVSLMFQGI